MAPPLLGLEETVRVDNEVVKMEDGKQNRVQTSGQWLGGLVEEGRGRERLEVPLVGLDYGVKVHCTGKIFLKVVPRALENLKTRFVINCKKKKKKKRIPQRGHSFETRPAGGTFRLARGTVDGDHCEPRGSSFVAI